MNRKKKLLLLSIGHLLIDLESIYLLNIIYKEFNFLYIGYFYIVYNIVAFGLQPFFGYYADSKNKYFKLAIIGSILPIIALFLMGYGILSIIIATIGNAMYHVGAGIIAINLYPDKAAPAGLFVAPGAIGVFLGVYFATLSFSFTLIICILGTIVSLLIYIIFKNHIIENHYYKIQNNFVSIVLLLLVVVLIRGLIGSILIFSWNENIIYSVLLISGVFIGKMIGGIFGDKYGYRISGIIGLLGSLPLLLIGYYIPICGILGALCFNITMGITLYLVIASLGKYKGFAFGLTTLTLVISTIPVIFGFHANFGITYIVIVFILVICGTYTFNKSVLLFESNINKEEVLKQ